MPSFYRRPRQSPRRSRPPFWLSNRSATTFTASVSGGISFAGTAVHARTKAARVSGGISFAGTAPHAFVNATAVAGGITFGGAGTRSLTKAARVSGGITFDGSAAHARTVAAPVSGGITFGGSGAHAFVNVGADASGGITFDGTAPHSRDFAPQAASGGVVFGGAGVVEHTEVTDASGGITFGGSAATSLESAAPPVVAPTRGAGRPNYRLGPLVFDVLPPRPAPRVYVYTPAEPVGGVRFLGSAVTGRFRTYSALGGGGVLALHGHGPSARVRAVPRSRVISLAERKRREVEELELLGVA